MWKSNFVQSIDNLASLESLEIQEFIFIGCNFIKKGWADFLLIEYEDLAKTKKTCFSWYSFSNKFQETVKLCFEYWQN